MAKVMMMYRDDGERESILMIHRSTKARKELFFDDFDGLARGACFCVARRISLSPYGYRYDTLPKYVFHVKRDLKLAGFKRSPGLQRTSREIKMR
jgi:hypothetical protein